MRTTLDLRLQTMLMEVARARALTEREEFAEAKAALVRLRAQCGQAGLRSAHVAWHLALACDGLGEFEAALGHVREALDIDPLATPYQRSHDLIVERIRAVLGDETRAADDPQTPRLYALLLESGEGDARSHLAMARWHLHRGESTQAVRILEALATLAPSCREAWVALAAAARAVRDPALALRADIEAAALEARSELPSRRRAAQV